MSSITQIYSLEFKNLLKNKLFTVIHDLTDKLIDNIISTQNDKFIKILSDLEDDTKKIVLTIFKETIEFFDDKFRNSKERKKFYHINILKDHRSIQTIFGELEFYRTYYETKDRKTHFYFIDELLGLDPYARYDANVKASSIDLAIKTNQKLAGELIMAKNNSITSKTLDTIPRQTINRWIKNWMIPIIKYNPIKIEGDTLYIMGDEKWIHEQIYKRNEEDKGKPKHIMSKVFVCFSGIEQKHSRRELKNRFVFITSSNTTWADFLEQIAQIYDFEKIVKIVFLSDAGKWLVSGAPDLKLYKHNQVIMCLCEFHVRQKVNRITTNKDYRELLNSFINHNSKKEFKALMNLIKENNPRRLDKLVEYEKYILSNWKKIHNMFESECKSSMESHISHYIAGYFSSRPKAYSRNNIESLLKLQEAKINGIDIKSLYLKSYRNTEVKTYTEKELNFSIFEKSSSSNIPIIESGKSSVLFNSLFRLAHP